MDQLVSQTSDGHTVPHNISRLVIVPICLILLSPEMLLLDNHFFLSRFQMDSLGWPERCGAM